MAKKEERRPATSTAVTESVRLDEIIVDAGTQVRETIDDDVVEDYAEHLAEGRTFPPVTVFRDGVKQYLADGFHRFRAHQRAGRTHIEAKVHAGTLNDALWFAVGANRAHGLRLKQGDKKRAIVLTLKVWPERSQRRIAAQVGCTQQYVAKVRAQVTTRCHLPERTVGTDGKSYPAKRETPPSAAGAAQAEGTRPSSLPANPRSPKAFAGEERVPPKTASGAATDRESAPDLEARVPDGALSPNDAEPLLDSPPEQRQLAVEAVRKGEARSTSDAVPRLSDDFTMRPPGRPPSPDASPRVAGPGAGAAADEQLKLVPAETRLPEAVPASIRAALGDIDFAVFGSAAEAEALGAKAYQRDAQAATGPWNGTVCLRPPAGRVAATVDRLLSELDAGRVTRAALLAKPDLSAIWLHRVLAHARLSVVVFERHAIPPRGVTDDRTVHGGMGLFVLGAHQPSEAFFEAARTWGHVMGPWRQVRPAPIPARATQNTTELQNVRAQTLERLSRGS